MKKEIILYYDLDDIVPFGKYKGKKLQIIINGNVDYISWCLKTITTWPPASMMKISTSTRTR